MNKLFVLLAAICSLTISCEQEINVVPSNRINDLTSKVISNSSFLNLDIPLSSINIGSSQFVSKEENGIFIPMKDKTTDAGIIALFNDKSEITSIAFYQLQTTTQSDLVIDEIKAGKFNGSFTLQNETANLRINIEKSKIVSDSYESRANGRNVTCNGMTERGGALDCAGARLEAMNWFDAALCYASFGGCFGASVISCAIDGCEV